MSLEFLSRWRMDISTLSPIHIGSGEEMDPFSYIIDNNVLYEFSQRKFLNDLSEQDRDNLLKVSDRDLSSLQNFFGKHSDAAIANSIRISKVPSEFSSLFQSRLGKEASHDSKAINQLVIYRMQVDTAKGNPLCPGSSLKGSIRTALLEAERKKKKISRWSDDRNFNLQKKLFGYKNIQADPMRLIRVTDAVWANEIENPQVAIGRNVVFAVNRKKKKEGNVDGSPQRVLEVVDAINMHAFTAEISLFQPSNTKKPKWQMKEISEACNKFYKRKFQNELNQLQNLKYVDEEWRKQALERVKRISASDRSSNFSFLLRVGCHSGAEFVTLDKVRKIKIKGQKKPESAATTWWLASSRRNANSDLKPFGWIIVECTPLESDKFFNLSSEHILSSGENSEPAWENHALKNIENRRASLQRDLARREKEKQEENRRQEEKIQLESLSPEQRKLKEFEHLLERTNKYQWKQGGSEVSQKANEILRDSEDWEMGLKIEAFDLLKRYFDITKFPKSKKGRVQRAKFKILKDSIT